MSTDINIVNLINQIGELIPNRVADADSSIDDFGESEVCLVTGGGYDYRFVVKWDGHIHEVAFEDGRLFYLTDDDYTEQQRRFMALTDIGEDCSVDLPNLAQMFSFFGPPAAVTLITKAMGQQIDFLTDALEDCRQECADKSQSSAGGCEPSPTQPESPKAPKSNIKRNLKIALAICGCGLVLGYVFGRFTR